MTYARLLAREIAHFTYPEREQVAACIGAARVFVAACPAVTVPALQIKLFTLPNAPERWVRELVAKAVIEEAQRGALATVAAA